MAKVLYEINKARVPSVYHCDVDTIRPAFRETAEVFNAALTDDFFHIEFEEDRRALRLVGEGEGWAKLPRDKKAKGPTSLQPYVARTVRLHGVCQECRADIVPGDTCYSRAGDGHSWICADCVPEEDEEDDSAEL